MKQVAGYGVFTIVKPINHTTSTAGIIIQGDDNTKIAKGTVVNAGPADEDGNVLAPGNIIFYLRAGSHEIPGTNLIAIHDDNIVGVEYEEDQE